MVSLCAGDDKLSAKVEAFAKEVGLIADASKLAEFLQLLEDVKRAGGASGTESTSASSGPKTVQVDSNICCFATGKLYTEALLGVGVSRHSKNLATAGELLSKAAYDDGLRQNTNKSAFEFFLPVWINEKHAASQPEWRDTLRKSCMDINFNALNGGGGEVGAYMQVFPRLINQMIVEMMKPDAEKSEAIALFEALCNFWRTFKWLVDTKPALKKEINSLLRQFVSSEDHRHKDSTPDLGMLLVCFSVSQGDAGCPSRNDFINAYMDECPLRWVMWWKRSKTPEQNEPVFQATQVSREILMFQMA